VDEHDEFDQETGDLLAVGRAYADLARQMKRAGWNRVHTTSKMAAGEAGAAAVKELLGIVPPVGAVVTADLTAPKPALKKRKRIGRMRRDVGHTY
jgi:hypothetical protein